jgi:hypothetical protein
MAAPSMSTPVSNLPPANAAPGNVRHDEDQIVADVLSEMRSAQQQKPPVQQAPPPPPPAHVVQQYVLPTHPPFPSQNQPELLFNVLDKTNASRALLAAFVALVLFYPESFENVYSKIPSVGPLLEANDKVVRAILLAVLLYVIMWKLNI